MKTQEFDQKFDDGEDITEMLDLSQAKRPLSAQKKVSIDLPIWMSQQPTLDRLGDTSRA